MLIACVAIFFRAIGGSINWTYSTIIVQKTAPDAKLGRMFSLDWMGFHLATVGSTLVHGSLIDAFGAEQVHNIAFATGIVSLLPLAIWVFMVWYLEKREIRQPYYEPLPVSVTGD
jgi:MFS family permease